MRPGDRAAREDKFSVGARFVLHGLTGLVLLGGFFGLAGNPSDYSGFLGLHQSEPRIQLAIDVAGWFVVMGIGGYWIWTGFMHFRRIVGSRSASN